MSQRSGSTSGGTRGRGGAGGARHEADGRRPSQAHPSQPRKGFHPSRNSSKVEAAAKRRRARIKARQEARKTGVPGEEVVQPHEPVLEVRPFSSVDFPSLVQLMPPEWFMDGMSAAERQEQARADLSQALAKATLALVATIDDGTGFDPRCVGFALARVPSLPAIPGSASWREGAQAALQALAAGSPAARRAHEYVGGLEERDRMLTQAAGDARGQDNELLLFVVSPEERGNGVGGALIGEFERRLRDAGQQGYWLQTDTTCSWQWYDAHGYERVTSIDLGDGFGAMMYRKRLG
jgi:GNAT superfamily N-acetyltransferase